MITGDAIYHQLPNRQNRCLNKRKADVISKKRLLTRARGGWLLLSDSEAIAVCSAGDSSPGCWGLFWGWAGGVKLKCSMTHMGPTNGVHFFLENINKLMSKISNNHVVLTSYR